MGCCGGGSAIWLSSRAGEREAHDALWHGSEVDCEDAAWPALREYLILQATVWDSVGAIAPAAGARRTIERIDLRVGR